MEKLDWENSIWYGDERFEIGHSDDFAMIGVGMTILMAAYSGNRTDVAIISDRRASSIAIGRATDVPSNESTYKTLRLGPWVAIGFCGAVPLSNRILACLLGRKEPDMGLDLLSQLVEEEDNFDYGFCNVVDELGKVVEMAITTAAPPAGIQTAAIIVGFDGERPAIAELNADTKWKAQTRWDNFPWCKPGGMTSDADRKKLVKYVSRPGLDYIASLKAAVGFCADRYKSVNHYYVLRRLRTGFAREEGSVPRGASLGS